jgi:hypothetical protein
MILGMRTRLSEREVVTLLLKELDLPCASYAMDRTASVVSLCLTRSEWEDIGELVTGIPLEDMAEAWRELPSAVWTDESWCSRVCMKFMRGASDYNRLILGETG